MSTPYGRLERGTIAAYNAIYSATMALPPKRDFHPQFPVTVTDVVDISPAFRRVTLRAGDLTGLRLLGADEYVGLFMPAPGVSLHLPDNALNPRPALARLEESVRPELRWYTIRNHRPEVGEVDIDIVSKGHDGPGARWIGRVRAGDVIGLRVQSAPYGSAPPAGHHFLLADETGLPGALAILDARPVGTTLTVLVEVPNEDYLPADARHHDIAVVHRGDRTPGTALIPALQSTQLPPLDYAWVCAEAATVAAARRHLVKEVGLGRRKIMASGFWKVGSERL